MQFNLISGVCNKLVKRILNALDDGDS